MRILEAVLSVGFGSGEAFTHAFRNRFGCAPSIWRKRQQRHRANSNYDQVEDKHDQVSAPPTGEDEASHTPTEAVMNVKLVERQPASVAYLRHLGPYGESIARFWQETYFPWASTDNLLDHPRYGISHDDPGITAPSQCRYDACAEVAPDFEPLGDALKTTIPGGRYACLSFKGTNARIGEAWTALLRDWLPSSGLQLDSRPSFEYYAAGAGYDPQSGEFECSICIPVMPL